MSADEKPRKPRTKKEVRPAADEDAMPDAGGGDDQGGGAPPPAAMEAPEEADVAPTPKPRKASVDRSLDIVTTPEVCNEGLVDKLKLLDYEKEFCKRKKPYRRPITAHYFAVPLPNGNHGEQFFYFTALTSWLLGLAGIDLPAPKEHDDPNLATGNIISAAKKLGFAAPTYTPMKLTAGYGKEVCGVLDGLVDYVLERRNFSYKKPLYLPDGYLEDEAADGVDEDPDMGAGAFDGADDFKLPEEKEDPNDDDAYMDLGIAPPPGAKATKGGDTAGTDAADKAMLTSKVDPTLWKLELERVGPKLRILLNADAKDWRTNLEEVHTNSKAISVAWPDSRGVLEKLRSDLNNSLEKLTTREKYLNEQFDRLMQQYRAQRMQLQEIQSTYNRHTEGISDRNNELHRITEQLSEMKHEMEDRGNNISDATPVVRIKAAIKKLSDELHEMEVRIGVVSHTHLQLTIKNRRLMHAQAAINSDDEDILDVCRALTMLNRCKGGAPSLARP